MNADAKATIVVICHEYPTVSQTFVHSQAAALRGLGQTVYIYALRHRGPNVPWFLSGPGSTRRVLARGLSARAMQHMTRLVRKELVPYMRAKLGMRLIFAVLHAIKLSALLPRSAPTVIHAHFASRCADVARMAAGMCGVPSIVTIHAADIYDPESESILKRRLERCDAVVAISSDAAKEVRRRGISPPRLSVVHLGVADAYAATRSHDPRLLLVTVARLVEKKGIDIAIRAVSELRRRGVLVEYAIVGDGPERATLQDLVRALDLGSVVHFRGAAPHSEALSLMRQALAVILPCRVASGGDRDGIPVSLMEAMSMGVPVVAGDVGGVSDLVMPRRTGWPVPPGDVGAVVQAIENIVSEPQVAERIAAAGRKHVGRHFSSEEQARRFLVAAQEVIGSFA